MASTIQTAHSVQKIITFSETLYANGLNSARAKGITFQEYIRHLLVRDLENSQLPLQTLDEATEKRVGKALQDYKQGRYSVVNNTKELHQLLNELDKKES